MAGLMIATQHGLPVSAEMFPVVTTAGQTARTHAAGDDVERAAGAEQDRLNSFAVRRGGKVRERRAHRRRLFIAEGSGRAFCASGRTTKTPDFLHPDDFPSEEDALGGRISHIFGGGGFYSNFSRRNNSSNRGSVRKGS